MEDDFEELLEAKPEKSAATGSSFTATITRGSIAALLAQGVKPPAIARALGMTQKEVLAAIRRNKLEAVDDVKIVASPQKIAANREANLLMFDRLRAYLSGAITKLESGNLTNEKIFASKGLLLRAEVRAGIQEALQIAQLANIIAEGSSKALGDVPARGTAPTGTSTTGPAPVVIVVPKALGDSSDPEGKDVAELAALAGAAAADKTGVGQQSVGVPQVDLGPLRDILHAGTTEPVQKEVGGEPPQDDLGIMI